VTTSANEADLPLVLVVDDSAVGRAQIEGFLRATECYRVITANDGFEALALARNQHPAIIVSDVTMPRLDGHKLAAAIKTNPATRHIQFILLTALSGVSQAVDGLAAGADDYVTKPFDASILCARVDAAARVARLYNELHTRTRELERTQTELQTEIAQRQRMEAEVRLANKLEAVGQLAAGVAHEINTPAQYVGDNLNFLSTAFNDIVTFLGEQSLALMESGKAEALHAMARRSSELEMDYLLEEMPRALAQASEGIAQIARIVSAMKDFAHPGGADKVAVNLNDLIESTVTISRNQWKDSAEVELDLDPELPDVPCLQGEIKQVLLNLITNAAHAIADKRASTSDSTPGRIVIRTRQHGEMACLSLSDTGCGIPARDADRVFDPFFTTKEVGRGTGQGLPIVRSVIVDRHGGRVTFDTAVGVGTTFHVWLPFRATEQEERQALAS